MWPNTICTRQSPVECHPTEEVNLCAWCILEIKRVQPAQSTKIVKTLQCSAVRFSRTTRSRPGTRSGHMTRRMKMSKQSRKNRNKRKDDFDLKNFGLRMINKRHNPRSASHPPSSALHIFSIRPRACGLALLGRPQGGAARRGWVGITQSRSESFSPLGIRLTAGGEVSRCTSV